MRLQCRKPRRAIAPIIGAVILFAILFSVGTSYFILLNQENSSYVSNLLAATNKAQASLQESLSVTTLLESNGDVGFEVNNTSSLTVNMTAALVVSSAGLLLRCDGVGFPAGSGCANSTPALWRTVNGGSGSSSVDSGYLYVAGTTDTVKVLSARGNTYTATYPMPASLSSSSQSVTVNLDNLKWVQLIPQASSLVQKKYVSNCNAASCSAAFTSAVTASNILVDAVGWANQAPPAGVPTDTRGDLFTLGASSSVAVSSSPSVVQNRYTSNCNAASCGLAFSSSVTSGNTLVYAIGWANQSPPSSPTDTRGDSFTLGSSQSVTIIPPTLALVQSRYAANCNSATCGLAFSSSVTAGNTLAFGLGWYGTAPYVPVTVTNCQAPLTLALDGSGFQTGSTSSSETTALTTANTNDVIVAVVYGQNTQTGTYRTPTVSDTSGLTWNARSSLQEIANSGGNSFFSQVFYAIAASTLSSDSIQVQWSSATTLYGVIQVFGVSGANTASPFDSHSGLPAFAGNGVFASVSTSNANDLVYGLENTAATSAPTTGGGWTGMTSGVASSYTGAEYQVVSSTQSSLSLTYSNSASDSDGSWGDAIQEGTGCGSSATALDGSAGATTESTSVSASLTTTNSNDVIILGTGTSSSSTTVSSVSDTGGHTWTHRVSKTGSPSVEEEEWYTTATSPLSADSITVTWSNSGDNEFTAFGISGANVASPFDTNGALPATATGTSASPTVSVSTSNANDFIFGLLANEHTSYTTCHTTTVGTGFTEILPQCAVGGSTNMESDEEYETVVATQSNLAIPWTISSGGSNVWAEIGDAVEASVGAATSATFQEMVTWSPSSYSTYESSTLGNIRFCADSACATSLDAWLESCVAPTTCATSSTSATAWVKLTSAIASGSSTTIYMVFEATSVNFDGNYWGEAPQLSSTYAQYDNGANVFNFYDDFTGTTLSGKWTSSGSNTVTVNNGLSIAKSGSSNNNPAIYTASYTQGAGAVDFYGTIPSGGGSGSYTWSSIGLMSSANINNNQAAVGDINRAYGLSTTTSGGAARITAGLTFGSAQIYSILIPTSSPSSIFGQDNYGSTLQSSTDMPTVPVPIAFEAQRFGVALGPIDWIRARAYPPNGLMPSTSFGGVTTGNGSPTTPTDTVGSAFTLGVSNTITVSTLNYYSYVWYATAASSGADTISTTFASAVTGSVSIYELQGYSVASPMTATGSSSGGSNAPSVGSFTPSSNSFVIGNVETGSGTSVYTAGSGYTLVATCSSVYGCSEYKAGVGTATTVPSSLGASAPWVASAISFAPLATNTYYSYIWYATAASSGADTIAASFGAAVAGSVSIYEINAVTATGLQSQTGSSTTSQSSTSVTSMTPTAGSVVIGNTEAVSTTYTAGSGYTLSGACNSVWGCGEYETGVGSATTVPMSLSPSSTWVEAAVAFAPTVTNYYSYVWYATVATSGADTIATTFGATVAGSVSIYEITGFTTSGALSSTGSSPTGSTTAAVTGFTPASDSFTVGAVEGASGSTTYTATSGFTLVGTCNSVGGCSEYNAGGGGSSNTVQMTLGSSTPWVEAAMSFSTPFNPQSGIQVNGYPTTGVPSGASLVWEVTFTNVDPQHRTVTIWPQTELAVGLTGFDGSDIDYIQEHYYIIDSLNPGSTTVNAYTSTTGGTFLALQYNVPTTLYFAATTALGSATQAFGTEVLTPFEAYFALTGTFSDGTLYGETIPYPYGIITQANAHTSPTLGSSGTMVTVSCTSPCHFSANSKAVVGWINSAGDMTQVATFTTNGSGNIPAGVTFSVPSVAAGYYTIVVTDYTNSIFMTFQHT